MRQIATFGALAFALGMSYMVNSWDAVTLGVLAVFLWSQNIGTTRGHTSLSRRHYLRTAYIVALPWSVTNHLPIQGSD